MVVIKVKGQAIWDALENSVSAYPALEGEPPLHTMLISRLMRVGRFPQVSNITFEFDPQKPPGSRIAFANIGQDPIDLDKEYVLSTRGYMARGKGKSHWHCGDWCQQ